MKKLLPMVITPFLAMSIGCASLKSPAEPNAHLENTSAHELYAGAGDDELLLLNGNTWGVPLLGKKKSERIKKVRDYVENLPRLPHVITFQEVWLRKQVFAYKEHYPEYDVYSSGQEKKLLFYNLNSSGLLTLVKKDLPVSSVEYVPLEKEHTMKLESFMGKGALSLTVRHEGHSYRIANIHLPNTHMDMRLEETQEALDWLKPEGIIAGDFNLEPHELPLWLMCDDHTPTYKSFEKNRVRRIDYVFPDATTNVESVVLTDAQGRCPPLSDHCFVAAKLKPKKSSLETRVAEKTTSPSLDEKAY